VLDLQRREVQDLTIHELFDRGGSASNAWYITLEVHHDCGADGADDAEGPLYVFRWSSGLDADRAVEFISDELQRRGEPRATVYVGTPAGVCTMDAEMSVLRRQARKSSGSDSTRRASTYTPTLRRPCWTTR
jgi:hypothetical protein